VLRLRGVELALKEELEKLRDQVQFIHSELHQEKSETLTPESTPTTAITIDWEEFYKMTPEPTCCITAAEATEFESPWTEGIHDASQRQSPPITGADAFGSKQLLKADNCTPSGGEAIETNRSPLTPQMGVNYILQYESPVNDVDPF
jgi:hypothetical protein